MHKIQFLQFFLIIVLVASCKKATIVNSGQSSVLEVHDLLGQTSNKFYELANQANSDPFKALMLTKDWVATQKSVEGAVLLDSTCLRILMKSGRRTTFQMNLTDKDGFSLYRGSKAGSSGILKNLSASGCTNIMKNKKVLIYAPAYSQLYAEGEMQPLLDLFSHAGSDFEVTVLKDEQCTLGVIKSFGDYGLVIIDTHGREDGFMIGTKVKFSTPPKDTLEIKAAIIQQAGQDFYDLLRSKDDQVEQGSSFKVLTGYGDYRYGLPEIHEMEFYVTTTYINSLASWSGTIILGNMCYSGANRFAGHPEYFYAPPIRSAFMNRDVISYYGYTKDSDYSEGVTDSLSKQMEYLLVKSFLVDGDSTGVAHLKPDNTEYEDYLNPQLKFKHFNKDNYCFHDCVSVFTDNRDGIIYKAVCIGKQSWMAENLRYNAPGSRFYDDNVANGPVYGKLYDWNTVMNGAATSTANPSGVQGICPKGWHLPSQAEWQQMADFIGGSAVAGKAMKSTSGWDPKGNGTNTSGFSAIGAGYWDWGLKSYANLGKITMYWTSEEFDPEWRAYYLIMNGAYDNITLTYSYKSTGMSVRCVKNN